MLINARVNTMKIQSVKRVTPVQNNAIVALVLSNVLSVLRDTIFIQNIRTVIKLIVILLVQGIQFKI